MMDTTEIKSLLVQFKKAIVKKGLVSAGNFPITARQLSKKSVRIRLVGYPDYSYECEIKNLDQVMIGLLVARDKGYLIKSVAERKYRELEQDVVSLKARIGTYGDKHNEADCKYKQIIGSKAFKDFTRAVNTARTELKTTTKSAYISLSF